MSCGWVSGLMLCTLRTQNMSRELMLTPLAKGFEVVLQRLSVHDCPPPLEPGTIEQRIVSHERETTPGCGGFAGGSARLCGGFAGAATTESPRTRAKRPTPIPVFSGVFARVC
jgi:hypothetical protein